MSAKDQGGPSVIEQLSAYVTTESFDKLPDATVRAARGAILDTLGVMLAGSAEVTAARVRALIAHRRGVEEATIAGTDLRGSVEDAALANGTAAHALDYDDVQQSLSGHPSVPILPAALALAERQHASGAALLVAFVVGVEVEAKLGRALNPAHYETGWHATSTLGVFGAAAAAAKLLGLSAERTAHALAIAASMASGIKANFGTDGKPWHAGHAAPMRRRGRAARGSRLHREPARARAQGWLWRDVWRGQRSGLGPRHRGARRAARGRRPRHRGQALPGLREHTPGPRRDAGPRRGARDRRLPRSKRRSAPSTTWRRISSSTTGRRRRSRASSRWRTAWRWRCSTARSASLSSPTSASVARTCRP